MTRTPMLLALATALAVAVPTQEPTQEPAPTAPAGSPPRLDPTTLAGLRFRSIGPAVCGGRIAAVASVPDDPTTIWVGAASGGVWKSTDAGSTFTPVFDAEDCTSIGALAIDPRTPDVVWVGTGEGNPRNSASVGRGVYKTLDGGRTWQKLGLDKTEQIHRIVLDPANPQTAFVAALGTTWGENDERGVFKTRDGGRTWEKVLFVDARTGCADLVMDPRNPDKLFAAMWEHRRWPWAFKSGGPGSGLWRSLDGGTSWKKLSEDDGLPAGDLGRIGLAIAASDPRVVYALVESKQSQLLRSDDGGFRFRAVNSGKGIAPRPFYFCDVRVDPQDQNRVYNLHVVIDLSTDGGRTFAPLVGWDAAHPDHHAMWIDPRAPHRIVIGNDGGVYQSQDRGATWRFCANLPLAQFYHVALDRDVPFHVYGGLQDNGSWRGPSSVPETGGIRNLHWQEVCFGDGFATMPDPGDSRQGYAMSQGGALIRWDLRTGQQKSIRPPVPEGTKARFHWNSALAQDPHDAGTIYYGSQFVHRSVDRGESWEVISPDLTTNNPEWQKQAESGGLTVDVTGAENHCTILTIAPSPVERGVLWAGTDDGRVQVTRDGGQSWTSVEERIPGLPRNTWCPHLEAGRTAAGTAFAVFDDHRRANWTPYVYRTDDFGQTWTSLATKDLDGYCLSIEQDPVQKDLLFLGTEFGLWFTIDGGAAWHRWKHGLPTASCMALAIHEPTSSLVVATHGRSVFVLDDLTPLRTLSAELQREKLHLFAPQDAIAWSIRQTPGTRFPGHGEFEGKSRQRGAHLYVIANADELKHPDKDLEKARQQAKSEAKKAAKKAAEEKGEAPKEGEPKAGEGKPDAAVEKKPPEPPKDHVTVEVRDEQDTLVRTFRRPVQLGLNRVVWLLERDGHDGIERELRAPRDPLEPPPHGREVLPGSYSVTVKFEGEARTAKVRVLPDPRVEVDFAARVAKDAALERRSAMVVTVGAATQRIARSRKDLQLVQERLALEPKAKDGEDDPRKEIRAAVETFEKALKELEEKLWGVEVPQGFGESTGSLTELRREYGRLTGAPEVPNATELLGLERAERTQAEILAAVEAFASGPLAAFRAAVEQSGLSLVPAAK